MECENTAFWLVHLYHVTKILDSDWSDAILAPIYYCGNKSYVSFHPYKQLIQESANKRVLPDLSLADIITITT